MRSTILQSSRLSGSWRLLALALVCTPGLTLRTHAQTSPSPDDDPFARRGWHLELAAHQAFETWNYNTTREEMIGVLTGLTYGLGKGLVLTGRSQLYYVDQRGVNGWLFGATAGLRGRIFRRSRTSVFLEFDLGISEADTIVPPRGTRFNYLALGGGGVTVRIRPDVHMLAGLRLVHVSNGGLAGRNRNPDIEAVGLVLGTLVGF
jgi:Lipid A 3-O-deacylase (PagL)